MKNKKLFLTISLIIVLFLSGSIFFKAMNKNSKVKNAGKAGKRKILYYRAPMDPTYISDKPGKSPMGMDLIPVYEGEETAGTGMVRINPVTVQNIGVRSELVERRNLTRDIRTVGRIDYDERKIAYVNTKIGGWIEKLYVDYTGQSVEKGEKLLEIYSPELVATQEEYLLALEYNERLKQSKFGEVSDRANSLLESSRKRLEYWDITEEQIEDLKKTHRVKKTLTIHSPTKGIVVHKNALEGKYTKPGENLYKIADISKIWVYADIYEYEVPWVKAGQEAEMSLAYLPGKVFRGRVTYLYPYLETKTRTVKVRMEFDNPDQELKPDMYADVTIHTEARENTLAVPKEAVIHSGERDVIIVDKGNGFFEPRDVKLGLEARDYYEVLSGVKEGEKIVTSSQFLIDSESRLKEAIAKMLEAKKSKATEEEKTQETQKVMKIKESTRKLIDEVWKHYFNIRKKLAEDSMADIAADAGSIEKDLKKILASQESKHIKELSREMLDGVGKLYSKDIVEVRDGFSILSKGIIKYMKDSDREDARAKKYKLFFCGMDEKYWVQKEEKIGNPYLGASMSNCGAPEDY